MSQKSQLYNKDFWKEFNVLDIVRIIGESWHEIPQKTLNFVWKQISTFFIKSKTELVMPETDQIAHTVEEFVFICIKTPIFNT